MKKFLVQSEFEETRFYKVTLDEKSGKKDTCNCFGVKQYLGNKKNGEPFYRKKNNCFHIEWARKHRNSSDQFLFCF